MFIKDASSPRLSGIGMPSPILWSHLLKMQRIVLLSSLLWWELGTNFLITGPGEWLSFRRFTSKLSWSWYVQMFCDNVEKFSQISVNYSINAIPSDSFTFSTLKLRSVADCISPPGIPYLSVEGSRGITKETYLAFVQDFNRSIEKLGVSPPRGSSIRSNLKI